jgi:hypothetical protein
MTASCQCLDCRYPTVGDPDTKDRHAVSHTAFEMFLEDRADRHGFTEPTGAEILRRTVEEWDVPARCPRAEHAGAPPHPAHT